MSPALLPGLLALLALLAVAGAAPAPAPAAAGAAQADGADYYREEANPGQGPGQAQGQREEKALPYYQPSPYYQPLALPLPPQYYDYGLPEGGDDNEVLSRTEPGLRRKPGHYPDSPVYYIRMPPAPYMFVPGLGYVSRPPPPPPAFSPFINLPVDFVANGKPTSVYQWRPPPPPPPPRPQDSSVTQLDQGPYVFNGRPTDLFLLRNSYNTLYSDALQNIYP